VYWGIISGLNIFGHNEFAVRFFNAACFILTALITGLLAKELFGDKVTGLLSAFIYATMAVPFIAANFVTPDTPLALWTTAAVFCFLKSIRSAGYKTLWQILLCVAAGLGFLAKGPAVLLPCGGMFVFLAVRKQIIRYFRHPSILAGLLIFVAVGLGWYFWVSIKVPGAFTYFFDSQIWGRLVSDKYKRHPGLLGALIYLPILVFGSLPWSVVWSEKRAMIADILLKRSGWMVLAGKDAALFLACWFFVPLVILCLASSKLSLYVLPVFPALAIATARLWREKVPDMARFLPKEKIRFFTRPAALAAFWVFLLIVSRLVLAYYPTYKNMRVLWADMNRELPLADYEIATVKKRADGLLFYGARRLEHVDNDDRPYPAFSKTEYILDEIAQVRAEKEIGVFLIYGDKDIVKTCGILQKADIKYKQISLPYNRALLILEPAAEAGHSALTTGADM